MYMYVYVFVWPCSSALISYQCHVHPLDCCILWFLHLPKEKGITPNVAKDQRPSMRVYRPYKVARMSLAMKIRDLMTDFDACDFPALSPSGMLQKLHDEVGQTQTQHVFARQTWLGLWCWSAVTNLFLGERHPVPTSWNIMSIAAPMLVTRPRLYLWSWTGSILLRGWSLEASAVAEVD